MPLNRKCAICVTLDGDALLVDVIVARLTYDDDVAGIVLASLRTVDDMVMMPLPERLVTYAAHVTVALVNLLADLRIQPHLGPAFRCSSR